MMRKVDTPDTMRLHQAEERLRAWAHILTHAQWGVLVGSADGRTLEMMNPAFARMHGYTVEELTGKPILDILAPESRGKMMEHILKAHKKGHHIFESKHLRKDGSVFPVLVNVTIYKNEAGEVLYRAAIVQDMTKRKEREQRDKAVTTLLGLFAHAGTRKEYFHEVIHLIREWAQCSCAGFRVLDEDGIIPFQSYQGYSKKFRDSECNLSLSTDQCICTRIALGRPDPADSSVLTPAGSFVCNDTIRFISELPRESQARYRAVCIHTGFTSIAVIPIRHQSKIVGLIHLADERKDGIQQGVVEFIEHMAPILGEAVHRFNVEDQLRRRQDLFEAVVETTGSLMVLCDAGGRILLFNRACEELTGYKRDEVLSKGLMELSLPSRWVSIVGKGFEDPFASELCEPHVSPWVTKSGKQRFIEWRCRVIPSPKDGSPCLMGTGIDITERKQAEEDLQRHRLDLEKLVMERTHQLAAVNERLREEITEHERAEQALGSARALADEANRAKSEFLANMSHEIRTPLSGIKGLTDMALEMSRDEAQRECLEMIQDATNALLQIINDILDFSKIEAGRLLIEKEEFDLHALILSTMQLFVEPARKKGLSWTHEIDPRVPSSLMGDPLRLRQILTNLMGNALKFTNRGEVELRVERTEGMEDMEMMKKPSVKLQFTVRDTGIGIPGEKRAEIFNPFAQADGSTAKKYGGSGLGLSICRKLVELMGGEIWVESEVGKGTTFHFTVGFDVAVRRVPQDDRSEIDSIRSGETLPLRILLAEDNVLNRKFLMHFLTRAGHHVTAVENGKGALDALEKGSFDLILMDVQMPEMDGIETTQRIRSSNSQSMDSKIPIIALTAYAMKGDRERLLEAGMDAYVSKPIEMEKLFRTMGEVIGMNVGRSEYGPLLPRKETATIDLVELKEEYGNPAMKALFDEVIQIFLREAPQRLDLLKQALEGKDLDQTAKIAHKLIGTVGVMKATRSVEYARALETAARCKDLEEAGRLLNDLEEEVRNVFKILGSGVI